MARYETGTGKDKKFWEIVVIDDSFHVRYGKVGKDGREGPLKQFDSPEKAVEAAEKAIQTKLEVGYKQVDEVVGEHARNPDLEAAIAAAPYDDAGYLVYADWLQEQGDPRGALAGLQQARAVAAAGSLAGSSSDASLAKKEDGLLKKHRNALLPARLRKFLGKPWGSGRGGVLEWRGGFVHKARLSRPTDRSAHTVREQVQLLLAHPSGRLLAELVLGGLGSSRPFDYAPAVRAVADAAPPALRALHIGDVDTSAIPLDDLRVGDLEFFARVPRLERLRVQASGIAPFSADAVPGLRQLSITTAAIEEDLLTGFQEKPWSALESLAIDVEASPENSAALGHAISGMTMPGLRTLALTGTSDTVDVALAVIQASWWSGLERLDLSGGALDDSHVDVLLGQRDRLAGLQQLDISRNILSDKAVESLSELCKEVKAGNQRPAIPPVSITVETVAGFSPNRSSMDRASKLARLSKWAEVGNDNGVLWGRCRGSSTYDVYADPGVLEAGCTCPSPLYPCKHSLALLLMAANGAEIPALPAPPGFIEACQDARYDSVWE